MSVFLLKNKFNYQKYCMVGKQISVEELNNLLQQGLDVGSVLVDVRTTDEFNKGAISGAINIPLDQITEKIEILRPYKTIYVYCLSGGRSQLALLQLASGGLTVEIINVTGGMLAWRAKGYPTV